MNTPTRALMPDYLRLIALFGIVLVNVQFIAFSALQGFETPAAKTMLDAVTLWLVNGLAMLKTYGLFSFMFGVVLGLLMRSAERKGLPFGRVYRNRMIGLMVIGIAHGCLFFTGDILTIYAVIGSVLYFFRNWTVARLVRVGTVLLVVQILILAPLTLLPLDGVADALAYERQVLTQGSYWDVVSYRADEFSVAMPFLLIMQGTSALGWFCLGLAAVKSGMIDNSDHPSWARARRWCLVPGVAVSLIGAGIWQWGIAPAGAALTIAAAPLATLGYLGLIAALARVPGPLMAKALAAGGSSLSIYLGQSIVLSTIFSGYGLGLWDAVDRLTASAIAVAVTLALILGVSLWRRRFSQGPFEWVLRQITYAGIKTKEGA